MVPGLHLRTVHLSTFPSLRLTRLNDNCYTRGGYQSNAARIGLYQSSRPARYQSFDRLDHGTNTTLHHWLALKLQGFLIQGNYALTHKTGSLVQTIPSKRPFPHPLESI